MSISTILEILGILIAAIGLSYTIYTYKIRKRIRLLYIEEDCIPLFKSIIKNMEGIKILYEDVPIKPSLIMLKGCILNSGNTDIDSAMIHEPLALKLPANCRWKRVRITDKSPDLKASPKIGENELEFNWDLMKKNEYIRFDSLIETELDNKEATNDRESTISKNLEFIHRITNLDKIKRADKPVLKPFSFPFLPALSILAGLFILSMVFSETRLGYLYEDANGNSFEVRLIAKGNGLIEIKGIKNKFSQKAESKELLKTHKITPIVLKKNVFKEYKAIFIFAFVPYLLLIAQDFDERRKNKRLLKLMGQT